METQLLNTSQVLLIQKFNIRIQDSFEFKFKKNISGYKCTNFLKNKKFTVEILYLINYQVCFFEGQILNFLKLKIFL